MLASGRIAARQPNGALSSLFISISGRLVSPRLSTAYGDDRSDNQHANHRSPPGTSIRCGFASIWSPNSSKRCAPTSCACRRPSVRTTAFRASASSGSAMSMSRSTARRAITASWCCRGCRSSRARSEIICGKSDCRHVAVTFGERAGLKDPITLHNFYVPAGGDIPDPALNPKFAHKLAFLDEMHASDALRPAPRARHHRRRSQCRAARMRRLESQAAALGRLAYADRMREASRRAKGRRLDRRGARLRAGADQALHLVELSLARLDACQTKAAGSIISGRRDKLADRVSAITVAKEYRSAERPSDHVPVTATLERMTIVVAGRSASLAQR